jgi:hypothetical protein
VLKGSGGDAGAQEDQHQEYETETGHGKSIAFFADGSPGTAHVGGIQENFTELSEQLCMGQSDTE